MVNEQFMIVYLLYLANCQQYNININSPFIQMLNLSEVEYIEMLMKI